MHPQLIVDVVFSATSYPNAYLIGFVPPVKNILLNPLHGLFRKTKKSVVCPFCKALFAEKIELVIHIRKYASGFIEGAKCF